MTDVHLRHADVRNEVVARCPAGHPQVLRCHPLRDGAEVIPFPTLFWLVCPQLIESLSRLEHGGWIDRLQTRLEEDEPFAATVSADHDTYIEERWSLLSDDERNRIRDAGLEATFRQRGIGGIRNRRSVKCLHLHYAHHLARGSTIGAIIEHTGEANPCAQSQAE